MSEAKVASTPAGERKSGKREKSKKKEKIRKKREKQEKRDKIRKKREKLEKAKIPYFVDKWAAM